jgi:hypothetical protein
MWWPAAILVDGIKRPVPFEGLPQRDRNMAPRSVDGIKRPAPFEGYQVVIAAWL